MKDLKKDITKVIKIQENVSIMLDTSKDIVMHAKIVIGWDGIVVS